ncbi:IclR family transcriptional regulator [Nocardia sp. CA-120079]|uniref:IclR family transcriptional regulator n=1 Tax=Nocardia sp. CA-120079 TaxID=3239974 RepID=UPI003D95F673
MTSMLDKGSGFAAERRRPPPALLERVTLIMDQFERPDTVRTLEQVASETGLPRSTSYRILEHLTRLHWLFRTPAGYRLGQRSLALGGHELGYGSLRSAAAPILHELAVHTKLVGHLAILDGTEIHYLDKVAGPHATGVTSRVGGRAPAHCTALGKAMLACMAPERIDVAYGSGVKQYTSQSVGTLDQLHRELGRSRNGSPAYEFGEYIATVGCVAVALRNPDGPIGAISVAANTQTALNRVAPLVRRAARAISDELLRAATQPMRHRT